MQKNLLRAFTLVEMLVVIAIIAVLAALLFPALSGMQERGKATQDMNNMRQIGLATQMYLNDNDNSYFGSAQIWMTQLNPKYIATWKSFQSPFDKRTASTDATKAPVSYGLNTKAVGALADKIANPSGFIAYAPAQDSTTTTAFQGMANSTAPGVTVALALSSPGGSAVAGEYKSRKWINVVFADWHVETMVWTTFISDAADTGGTCANGAAPSVSQRWHLDPCNPAL